MFIFSCTWCVSLQRWRIRTRSNYFGAFNSTLSAPQPDDSVKEYPEKIINIVDEISKLTLVEVADLNELLKVNHFIFLLKNKELYFKFEARGHISCF